MVLERAMLLLAPLLLFLSDATPADVLLRRGLEELQRGQLTEAKRDLRAASETDSRNPFVWISLAQVCLRLHDTAEAGASAAKAEKYSGGDARMSYALAMFYSEAGDWKRAAGFEEDYARKQPADVEAQARAASLYLRAGNSSAALALAQGAFDRAPTAAHENLLARALAAGGSADALAHFEHAWSQDPVNEAFCFDYSQALLQRQDYQTAAKVLEKGLAAHPKSAQLELTLGVARYGERRFDDAIAAFLATIRLDPSADQPYRFLGRMLDQAGPRLPDIARAYRARFQAAPDDYQAAYLLAKVQLTSGAHVAEAERLLRRSIRLNGKFPDSHLDLGVLLVREHKYRDAQVELERAVALNPSEPTAHYHLSRVYDRLGEPAKAQAERELHQKLSAAPAAGMHGPSPQAP